MESELIAWATKQNVARNKRAEYLQNPEEFSDLGMKRQLLAYALKPIAAASREDEIDPLESKGANMDVYDFMPEALENLLKQWMEMRGNSIDNEMEEKIRNFAAKISRRFVFKVGSTEDFPIKFGPKAVNYPRDDMHECFAPLGCPVKPTMKRVKRLAKEVLRMNTYIGNEKELRITGPNLYDEIRTFLDNPSEYKPNNTAKAFIIMDEGSGSMTMPDLDGAESVDAYQRENAETRKARVDEYREDLKPFFDGVVTIGLYDTIRRILRFDRHTTLDYEQARKIIEQVCETHKRISFLMSEQTTYGYDPRLSGEEWEDLEFSNQFAVINFKANFRKEIPKSLQGIFQNKQILEEFCHCVMEHHHDIPEYEVDPATSVLSVTMMSFLLKAAYLYVARPGLRRRNDFEKHPALAEFFEKLTSNDVESLIASVQLALKDHAFDVKKGRRPRFRRYEKTQVKTQDRIDYDGESEVVEGPISVRELINNRPDLFEKYPEIAEKLLVCYYQIYKMSMDTGYIPDLRPENIIKNLFIMGEWAVMTDNIQITIFKNAEGKEYIKIVNLDPEDHFRKEPESEEERDPDEGLARYGFMLGNIGVPSIKKAVARFTELVGRREGVIGEKERLGTREWMRRWAEVFQAEIGRKAEKFARIVWRSIVAEYRRRWKGE